MVSTTELSGGARIARLLHERFPYELAKVETDEQALRQEIGFAIRNINAVRLGLFAPDQAFNVVVKRLISDWQAPCIKVLDLVKTEVSQIIGEVTTPLARFPALQTVVDSLVRQALNRAEGRCREQLKLLIAYECAYMNTKHDDFALATSSNTQRSSGSPNQVIYKGWLTLGQAGLLGRAKEYWFCLGTNMLTWFTDNTEKEMRTSLPLDGLKLQLGERKTAFSLVYEDSARNVYKDNRTLDLVANSEEECETWQASFMHAGVYRIQATTPNDKSNNSNDPVFERQVETICNLVSTYMAIVSKTLRDQVPKIIVHMMINGTKDFIADDLLASVFASEQTPAELMAESPAEKERRETMTKMYEACQVALGVISDVSTSTKSEPLPPPIATATAVKPARPVPRAVPPRPNPQKPTVTFPSSSSS